MSLGKQSSSHPNIRSHEPYLPSLGCCSKQEGSSSHSLLQPLTGALPSGISPLWEAPATASHWKYLQSPLQAFSRDNFPQSPSKVALSRAVLQQGVWVRPWAGSGD